MKNVLIVFGHENSKTSFNAAMKDVAIETLTELGFNVKMSCLTDMNFQCASQNDIKGDLSRPENYNWSHEMSIANTNGMVSDEIKQEQEKVTWADTIIYQYPIHSLSFPAVVAAWNAKVLSPNFAQTETAFFDEGLLKGKQILLSMTFGGPASAYTAKGMFGDINIFLYGMMKPMHFFGVSFLKPQLSYGVFPGNNDLCVQNLEQWRQRLTSLDKEQVLTTFTLPDSCFNKETFDMTDESVSKYDADEYGPTVGQNLGKKLPRIV